MAPKSDKLEQLSGTDLVHADDARAGPEVGPSISVSTSKPCPFTARSNHLTPISSGRG